MKQLTKSTFILLLAVACSSAQTQNEGAKNVSVTEFNELIEKGTGLLLDVRTPEEFEEGYIEGAKNMNFYDDDFDAQIEKLDKDKPVLVYCGSGGRSAKTMSLMKEKGFKEVYNLLGGYGAWVSQK
ncbi:MAG: rhodanese-like domain-containing protein [Cytophagales bacterium]|nr:rhodanese-like domain-containing protein [Cytophagales bacterium]